MTELSELYEAASKGFHISETCGPDKKYWHVSKFQTMAELHAFEDAWRKAMISVRDTALSHAAGQEVVEALIEEVQAFADAYPTDVFGPVTDDEREQYGSLIARASASMGRHMGRRFLPKALALRAALCPAPGVDGLRQGNWHHPDGGRIVGWVIEPDDVERMGADSFCLPREVAEALANLRDRNTAVARSEGEGEP